MAPSKSSAQKPAVNGVAAASDPAPSSEPQVSSKKQKKRQKQAARLAAEQPASQSGPQAKTLVPNGQAVHPSATHPANGRTPGPAISDYRSADYDDHYESRNGEDLFYSEEDGHEWAFTNP